jgi:NADH dehydrogenase FAD-containing subunit
MSAQVVVVGGGYGGFKVAQALDDVADVVLVERKDAFVHNVAALRAAVDPEWAEKIFLPYDRLLRRGRVLRDRAVRVRPGEVTLARGGRVGADYIVLATGSTYPFPAKSPADDTATALRAYASVQAALAAADRILLLGAGPVGLEMAGEITSRWPEKNVTIVDVAEHILDGGYRDELREELTAQLKDRRITLLLGSPLAANPGPQPGVVAPFTVTTRAGVEIRADLWLRCYGVSPVTDYLADELAAVRTPAAQLRVDEYLRLDGQDRMFAVGDITALDEPKMAGRAGRHADVVADNIRALINGEPVRAVYEPSPPVILVPLGPDGGAAQLPGSDGIAGADIAAQYKGRELFVDRYRELFGLQPGSPS